MILIILNILLPNFHQKNTLSAQNLHSENHLMKNYFFIYFGIFIKMKSMILIMCFYTLKYLNIYL